LVIRHAHRYWMLLLSGFLRWQAKVNMYVY
jgi:hypothetical protein